MFSYHFSGLVGPFFDGQIVVQPALKNLAVEAGAPAMIVLGRSSQSVTGEHSWWGSPLIFMVFTLRLEAGF